MADDTFNPSVDEWYHPSQDVLDRAIIKDYEAVYAEAQRDPQAFWEARAATVDWYQPWERVLDDSNPPFFKWFTGGKTNIVLNALDRHVQNGRGGKVAYYFEGEAGDKETWDY